MEASDSGFVGGRFKPGTPEWLAAREQAKLDREAEEREAAAAEPEADAPDRETKPAPVQQVTGIIVSGRALLIEPGTFAVSIHTLAGGTPEEVAFKGYSGKRQEAEDELVVVPLDRCDGLLVSTVPDSTT